MLDVAELEFAEHGFSGASMEREESMAVMIGCGWLKRSMENAMRARA